MQNPLPLIWPGLIAINLFAFIFVGQDKKRSREYAERSPEVMFFLIGTLFGSLGIFLGMLFFHHKTRKVYFPVGIGLLLIEQVALLYMLSQILNVK